MIGFVASKKKTFGIFILSESVVNFVHKKSFCVVSEIKKVYVDVLKVCLFGFEV